MNQDRDQLGWLRGLGRHDIDDTRSTWPAQKAWTARKLRDTELAAVGDMVRDVKEKWCHIVSITTQSSPK